MSGARVACACVCVMTTGAGKRVFHDGSAVFDICFWSGRCTVCSQAPGNSWFLLGVLRGSRS